MKPAAWIGLTGLMLSGCSLIASRSEYALFRSYRYETNADRRTALGGEYMRTYPHGQFTSVVMADVGRREDEFWEERRSTLEGLQAYLRTFPSGTHVEEARTRIEAYDAERRRIAAERAAAEQAERDRIAAEQRAASERQRLFARATMLSWLRTLGSLDGWGEPIPGVAQRNPDFNTAFGSEPGPVCRAGRCRKSWQVDFFVPVPGRSALPRRLNLSLDLLMRERRVVQAALVMHRRGLSTWFESETHTACDVTNADARGQSIRWAMDQLKGVVATAFPEARETPAELVGPEPEMEGAEEDQEAAAQAAAQPAPPIPPQPLGVQWSFVVGCGRLGGAQITIPENATPAGWTETSGNSPAVRSCLRIDAYSAPDVEGVSTDEGIRLSWIPDSALPHRGGGPARPPAGRPGARPGARPAGRR